MIQTETTESGIESSSSITVKVCIQGGAGAFHEIAARHWFEQQPMQIVPALTFPEMVDKVEKQQDTDVAIMAIENTLAGSILFNYLLLYNSNLQIFGEVFLRIKQNLLALPGQRIEDLTEVRSHPMAIEQCREFFRQYPHIRLVESEDTALSAKNILEHQLTGVGAIASTLAAEMYGMEILAASIETNKQNHTRFLLIEPKTYGRIPDGADKVSLCFATDHTSGSLHKVLAVLAAYQVNLTKIQSAPIVGKPWEYRFFLDFVMNSDDLTYEQAIEAIRPITHDLQILGIYKQGKHFE